jgi:uncharacterized membrane protein YjgN (DUF898 family)
MADDEREPGDDVVPPASGTHAQAGAHDSATIQPDSAPIARRADAQPEDRPLAFSFTGSTSEYFRIWVVNTCLSLLTLGLFSAWAKVRKKRYLYSHTVLDGTPFEYLGRPLPILKGRLVAVGLFATWYVATHFVLALLPAAALAGLALAPWIMVRSLAFNARYSAFRNINFQFSGRYWGAARVIGAGLVLLPLTLGIYYPRWKQRLQRFAAVHSAYGGVTASFGASVSDFFAVYFLTGFIIGVPSIGFITVASVLAGSNVIAPYAVGMLWAGSLIAAAYIRASLDSLVWQRLSIGRVSFQYQLTAPGLLALYVTNLLAIGLSLGLLIPWATIRTARYRAARFKVFLGGELSQFRASSAPPVRAAGAELGEFFDLDFSL